MRFANLAGRLVLLSGDAAGPGDGGGGGRAVDVSTASDGRFPADPREMFADWDGLLGWAAGADHGGGAEYDPCLLGPPVPRPRQLFAVALNYRTHAAEAGFVAPPVPLIFTKFPSCVTGPGGVIQLPAGNVDWELELVAVVGRTAHQVSAANAWSVVAGLTVGQDLSERLLQMTGTPPQFCLGKSYPGFGPIGPALVTPDELTDPDDLELTCTLNGELVQRARTKEMIFSVPDQIAHITSVCPVYPGDLIFTGTPAGVGNRRTPPRFLRPGDELVSTIGELGTMRHRFTMAG